MDHAIVRRPSAERRRFERRDRTTLSRSVSGRLRPGREVVVLDVCELGALVEGSDRLRPGAAASLNLILDGEERTVSCHVVWCRVSSLSKDTGVCYRAGLVFDRPIGLPEAQHPGGYRIPTRVAARGTDRGSDYSDSGGRREGTA